tara:strand:+ start:131 stop:640 length:510 start_codon:yes stop_codon:yes gene_type:complete
MINPSSWVIKILDDFNHCYTLIDIACGQGRHVKKLYKRFKITAVDNDIGALEKLKKIKNVEVINQDLEDGSNWLFSDRKFDVVLVTNYLFRKKIKKLFQLVNDNGLILYETFAVGNEKFGKPNNPNYLLKENELLNLKPDNFMVVDYFHGQVELPKPALIQRLAAIKKN